MASSPTSTPRRSATTSTRPALQLMPSAPRPSSARPRRTRWPSAPSKKSCAWSTPPCSCYLPTRRASARKGFPAALKLCGGWAGTTRPKPRGRERSSATRSSATRKRRAPCTGVSRTWRRVADRATTTARAPSRHRPPRRNRSASQAAGRRYGGVGGAVCEARHRAREGHLARHQPTGHRRLERVGRGYGGRRGRHVDEADVGGVGGGAKRVRARVGGRLEYSEPVVLISTEYVSVGAVRRTQAPAGRDVELHGSRRDRPATGDVDAGRRLAVVLVRPIPRRASSPWRVLVGKVAAQGRGLRVGRGSADHARLGQRVRYEERPQLNCVEDRVLAAQRAVVAVVAVAVAVTIAVAVAVRTSGQVVVADWAVDRDVAGESEGTGAAVRRRRHVDVEGCRTGQVAHLDLDRLAGRCRDGSAHGRRAFTCIGQPVVRVCPQRRDLDRPGTTKDRIG